MKGCIENKKKEDVFMMDKYNMTQEQNIFFAKRNIVDSLWKSANLEGIAVTFPETQQIYDGGNVGRLRIDEVVAINNLKHAWQFILSTIDAEIEYNYISSIHSLVGGNLVEAPGKIRVYDVKMSGTNWRPGIPTKENLEELLEDVKDISCETERAIVLMCKLMKMQLFNDGNKRLAMLVANHEMIKLGRGIISVSEENKIEFGTKLIKYYEDEENLEALKQFIFDNCIDGIC